MSRLKIIIPILVTAGLLFVAYSNSFYTPLHYDDSVNLIRNKNVHMESLTWESLKRTFFAGGLRGDIYHPILYRPVAMTSLAWNYYFHELDVLGYHIFNFAVHLITAIFLFLFINLTLNLPSLKEKYGHNSILISFFATALWALNPVQLTSVTYVVQRMTSLAGMFYIMAMYFYLRARTGGSIKYAVISFLCVALGVLSKENAIMVVLSIALFDIMFIGQKHLSRNIAIFLWVALAGVFLVYAVQGPETFSFDKLQAGFAKRDFTMGQRVLTEPRVILFYIMLLFFPSHNLMSLTHDVPISKGLFSPPETFFSIVIIGCILVIVLINIKKYRLLSFAVLFFFLNHLIEGSIIPLELVYEHRNYVPSFFLFLPVAILIVRGLRKYRKPAAVLASGIILFFIYNTYTQNETWKSDLTLWHDTVAKSPDPRSWFNLAGAYYTRSKSEERQEGDMQKALKYWTVSRDFNQLYGTNYKETNDIIPYGRVMHMAQHNAMMLTMLKDGKIRRAWKIKKDLMKNVEIRQRGTHG